MVKKILRIYVIWIKIQYVLENQINFLDFIIIIKILKLIFEQLNNMEYVIYCRKSTDKKSDHQKQ